MIFFCFKEWFHLNENAFEDQSLAILNQDQHLLDLIKKQCPEPKYLPIIAYFYKQTNNLKLLIQNINKYKEFVDKKKLQMIQITKKGAFLNNREIDYIKFTEIIHAVEASNVVKVNNLNVNHQNLKPIFSIKDQIDVFKAKDVNECIILGKGYTFCISNPIPGLNMWNVYRSNYDSTFYFVFEKTRSVDDPLKIVVVDARKRNDYALTDASNDTGKIAEFNSYKEYFDYLESKYGINSYSIFKNDPLTHAEIIDKKAVEEEINTLENFKQLTLQQKDKYIGNGYLLTNEQFDFIFDNNMTNLVLKYISTGMKLNLYQLNKIFKNASYKKTYLRQRLIAQEYLKEYDIGRFEYLSLDNQDRSKIDLNKINKNTWLFDAIEMGDEQYFIQNKNQIYESDSPFRLSTYAYKKAINSNNINMIRMIDQLIEDAKPKSINLFFKDIFEHIAENGTSEILKHFVEKYYKDGDHLSEDTLSKALLSASKLNKKDMVKFIIDKFDIKDWMLSRALFEASNYNSVDVLQILLENPLMDHLNVAKVGALKNAAKNGNINIARILLSKIEKNKYSSYQAIFSAIENNQYKFLEFIFNQINEEFESKEYVMFLQKAIDISNLPIFKLIFSRTDKDMYVYYAGLLDYAKDRNLKNKNKDLYDFIKNMIYNHFYNVAKETVVSKEINEKSDDEIKRLFRIFRDNYEIEDFKELRNLAKDHNNMNIYRVLSNAPFLNHE